VPDDGAGEGNRTLV